MACVHWNKRHLRDISTIRQDHEFAEKQSITEVHLCFNFISEVPCGTLHGFTSLTSLSLNCNCLTAVPAELEVVPNLTELHLANNQISVIENLEFLHRLKCLNLRCNRIKCIGKLKANTLLEILTLSGNAITSINWEQLPELNHLTFLGLSNNQICDFADILKLLTRAPDLREVYLCGNPCTNSLPLTLTSVFTCSAMHLDGVKVSSFLSSLKDSAVLVEQEHVTFESVCEKLIGEDSMLNSQRLIFVLERLWHVKHGCPSLVKVDGEYLLF